MASILASFDAIFDANLRKNAAVSRIMAIQAMRFAGANFIFYGDKLLTTGNPDADVDRVLFAKLGLHPA